MREKIVVKPDTSLREDITSKPDNPLTEETTAKSETSWREEITSEGPPPPFVVIHRRLTRDPRERREKGSPVRDSLERIYHNRAREHLERGDHE